MAASSRSMARRSGFWHDHARAVRTRPTCALCRRTPNSRWITVAIRRVVHSSVSKPHAEAPRSKRRGSFARCRAVNFGGRPGAGLAVKAAGPRRATASRHRMTELWEHPSRRATSVIDAPAFNRSTARRRRLSNSSGLPWGLIPEEYTDETGMSITYAHVNNASLSYEYKMAERVVRASVAYVQSQGFVVGQAGPTTADTFSSAIAFEPLRSLQVTVGTTMSKFSAGTSSSSTSTSNGAASRTSSTTTYGATAGAAYRILRLLTARA